MIITLVFNGGLGNQMFQYAFYLRMRYASPFSFFLFDIEPSQRQHHGYELDRVFNINSKRRRTCFRLLKQYCPKTIDLFKTIIQENSLEFVPDLLKVRHPLLRYEGFWQSEAYFKPVEGIVRKAFIFREELLNKESKGMVPFLKSKNSVSVHVRRGDYLQHQDYYGQCTESYYKKAIESMQERVPNPFFVFFSDDMEWVKQNIKCENAKYVTWNTGKDSWQDMYLMSCCKHNIVANSSFSWWGAWLNSNPNKQVIAPTPWFNYSRDFDIFPPGWKVFGK